MSRSWQVISLIGLLMVGTVFVGCSLKGSTTGTTNPLATDKAPAAKLGTSVGDTAPDFELTSIDGAPVSLKGLRGQPVVLVFWTAWCATCEEEAPHFNELAARYEPRGVRVLGINIQDSLARTQAGVKDFGIRYAVARDADASVARRYNVAGTPTVVLLDKLGTVKYFGNALPEDYSERLDSLIAGE